MVSAVHAFINNSLFLVLWTYALSVRKYKRILSRTDIILEVSKCSSHVEKQVTI